MEQQRTQGVVHTGRFWFVLFLITLSMIAAFAYAFMRITAIDDRIVTINKNIVILDGHIAMLRGELSSTTGTLYGVTGTLSNNLSELSSQTTDISQTLTSTKEDVASATHSIAAVQGQVGGVVKTIGSISGTVSTLQKLSTTDQELLRKYSKVYFLNENYTPAHLNVLPQDYVYSNKDPEQYLAEAEPFLTKMLDAAKADGVVLYVRSAYRSFATQQLVKSRFAVTYGAGTANSFSADQGYSEHQLGTAVDFITSGFGGQLTDALNDTPSFKWLRANAYKYGFEMSYPASNSYYVYEPWHWRFVGVKLATYLHDKNLNFYDMDQRDIDSYLADLFDATPS